ncbi:MAG: L,D-transpeptidase family protein [Candidatus Omnitrophota bacterium]
MNKQLITVLVSAFVVIALLLFGVQGLIVKRSAELLPKTDLEIRTRLLNLAESYKAGKHYAKAKDALKRYTEKFPDAQDAEKIRKEHEEISMEILLSATVTDDSLLYEIRPGDSLTTIASRFGTTLELLKISNDLKSDLIYPGRFIKVTRTKFNILVDKSENTLWLRGSNGDIVKRYAVSTGANLSTPVGTFKIEEKLVKPVWYTVGAVVDPDSSEYELGSRWMGLSVEGYGIHGTRDASTIGQHITKGCVRMRNEDVEELYAIVPSGTTVTIVE